MSPFHCISALQFVPTNLSADQTNCTGQHRFEGVHQCSPAPTPCGRGQARAITMVMGERRSRQKKTLLKKICPLTSLFFTIYKQLISTGWRVYINVPWPRGLADADRRGLSQWEWVKGGPVKKKSCSKRYVHSPLYFFTIYKQLISTGWRVYINEVDGYVAQKSAANNTLSPGK